MEREKLIKLFNVEADCSSIKTDEDENEYIEKTMSCDSFVFCVNRIFNSFTDEGIGEIVEKIAYHQLAEEQADDFIEKVWIVKDFFGIK